MNQSNFMKIYLIPIILISPMMVMSCNSWFSMWMMMEMNLMTFTPMIIYLNKYFKELAFKYFIIQTLSSSTLILMANSMLMNLNNYMWITSIMNLSLLMKLGFPPFHYWFINLMNNMTWINCLILSTWQKIIPMIMMMFIYIKNLNLILIIMGSILSVILSLNHQSLRIILTYSSINHMSWMILNLMISEMMWIMYFSMYTIITSSIMMILNNQKIMYINQMLINKIKQYKMIMFFNILSISGLPPMFGFSMKWMSIYFYSINNMYLINTIMIMMSMLTFIFYTRLSISIMMIKHLKNKLNLMQKFNMNLNSIIFMSFLNLWTMTIWMF